MEPDPEPLDEADVHLDRLARQPERGHADEHRAAAVGQAVVDVDAETVQGELPRDRDPGRAGTHHRNFLRPSLDVRHDVGDARGLVPLDEEALHRTDREGPVDVAAAAGALARRGADVGAHRGHRVGLPGEDVALLEATLGGEVQVSPAIRADRTRLLALDVALEPRSVDRLDEELLADVEGQGEADLYSSWADGRWMGAGRPWQGRHGQSTTGSRSGAGALASALRARGLTWPELAATLAGSDGAPGGAGQRGP